ncbi:MAG: amidohydrolase [Hyphomonadaceae bacterium]|nr:amidohydrolase [Hyphomonadaceae bacterium]
MTIDRRALLGAGALTALGACATAQSSPGAATTRPRVIDVHTHMFTTGYVEALRASDDPLVSIAPPDANERYEGIRYKGDVILRLSPTMLDWDLRIAGMDRGGVDIGIISLTAPNVYWGSRAISRRSAEAINAGYAEAQQQHPTRIRWFASLPWDYPEDAIAVLRQAKTMGATGVCTLTNIRGRPLTHEDYRPIWREIEAMEMPVFVHPTSPRNPEDLEGYNLGNTVGMTNETSLCFARMMLSGFLDAFPRLELVAAHGGGTLPYIIGRLDQRWRQDRAVRTPSSQQIPSAYLRRLWFDALVYDEATMRFFVEQVGADRIIYGSDFPFRIGDMEGVIARASALPAAQRDAILNGNAARLFKL